MGLMLTFMFFLNMRDALVFLPALTDLFYSKKERGKAEVPEIAAEA